MYISSVSINKIISLTVLLVLLLSNINSLQKLHSFDALHRMTTTKYVVIYDFKSYLSIVWSKISLKSKHLKTI